MNNISLHAQSLLWCMKKLVLTYLFLSGSFYAMQDIELKVKHNREYGLITAWCLTAEPCGNKTITILSKDIHTDKMDCWAQRFLFYNYALEKVEPSEHVLRKLKKAIQVHEVAVNQ